MDDLRELHKIICNGTLGCGGLVFRKVGDGRYYCDACKAVQK